MAKFKRILLKLSGESLMGKQSFGIDPVRLGEYAEQIKEVHEMGVQIGIVIGDMVAAKDAFGAICAALYHKAVTGEGQYIDISMLECMTSMNLYIDHAMVGLHPARRGKHHISLSPYGIFEGKNGQTIVIAAFTDYHFGILCREVLHRP